MNFWFLALMESRHFDAVCLQFFNLEKKLANDKLLVLKNDVLSNENIVNVKNLMKAELGFAEKYLNGLYNDFNEDPDYKIY